MSTAEAGATSCETSSAGGALTVGEEAKARTAEHGAERAGRTPATRRPPDAALRGDREIATPAANESMPITGPLTAKDRSQIAAGLREYAEQSSHGLAIIDRETRLIRYANPAFRRMRSSDAAILCRSPGRL